MKPAGRPSRRDDGKAAALAVLFDAAVALFHRLRATAGEVHGQGEPTAGRRGVLRDLSRLGPQTVPQMARRRPVSRQHIQLLVNGLVDTRHVVYCNRQPIPLHPTGRAGEFVAGVRFKAWKPPSSLHPTLPIDAPLVFDLLDTWSGRAIGGCTYHVAHPGGLSHADYPTNGLAAESRRFTRFTPFGHTPGPIEPPRAAPALELPLTLDLRRAP